MRPSLLASRGPDVSRPSGFPRLTGGEPPWAQSYNPARAGWIVAGLERGSRMWPGRVDATLSTWRGRRCAPRSIADRQFRVPIDPFAIGARLNESPSLAILPRVGGSSPWAAEASWGLGWAEGYRERIGRQRMDAPAPWPARHLPIECPCVWLSVVDRKWDAHSFKAQVAAAGRTAGRATG